MSFEKTITLNEDANEARAEFSDALQQDWILMVVLHTGQEAKNFVEKADASAGSPDEPYYVIWSMTPSNIQNTISGLDEGAVVANDLANIRGFSISRNGKICDVINMQETPDEMRVELAWANAEAEG